MNDPGLYMPKDELERWKARDPLLVLRGRLERAGEDAARLAAIEERVERLIDEAVAFAEASPQPSVEAFRAGDLSFLGIVDAIDAVVAAHIPVVGDGFTLAAVSDADRWARTEALARIGTGVH